MPRWYSTTTAEAPACTYEVVRIEPEDMWIQASNGETGAVPSLDHSWEKGWLSEFLTSLIDDGAQPLADVASGAEHGAKMSCNEFKRFMFNAHGDVRGDRNELEDTYNALASHSNVDFVGMTQVLNGDGKVRGMHWRVVTQASTLRMTDDGDER